MFGRRRQLVRCCIKHHGFRRRLNRRGKLRGPGKLLEAGSMTRNATTATPDLQDATLPTGETRRFDHRTTGREEHSRHENIDPGHGS